MVIGIVRFHVLQSFPGYRDLGVTAYDRPSASVVGTTWNLQKTIEKDND